MMSTACGSWPPTFWAITVGVFDRILELQNFEVLTVNGPLWCDCRRIDCKIMAGRCDGGDLHFDDTGIKRHDFRFVPLLWCVVPCLIHWPIMRATSAFWDPVPTRFLSAKIWWSAVIWLPLDRLQVWQDDGHVYAMILVFPFLWFVRCSFLWPIEVRPPGSAWDPRGTRPGYRSLMFEACSFKELELELAQSCCQISISCGLADYKDVAVMKAEVPEANNYILRE